MDILYRLLSHEVRKKDDGKGCRMMTFVASDGSRDSAHTVLNQDNWDLTRFNANPIIGYQHKVYGSWDTTDNPDNVIGKGYAYVKDGQLLVDVEFESADINPLADKIYKKLQFGSLRAVSVGFIPKSGGNWGKDDEGPGEKNETYYYAGQELLEISIVNIPANPKALKKGADVEKDELEALRQSVFEARKAEKEALKGQEKPQNDTLEGEMRRALAIAEAEIMMSL